MSIWPFSREARELRREMKREEWRIDQRERESHEALLLKAADNAGVHLVCHSDTWNFIAIECGTGSRTTHFNPPGEDEITEDSDGRVQVPVSGRTLAAILDQMTEGASATVVPTVEKAMAKHIRDAIVRALEDDEEETQAIVIDPHPDDEVAEKGAG